MLLSRFINHFVWMCYICVLYVPSYSEVKRVYDVCQYIFSGEGEYALDMHYIFAHQRGVTDFTVFSRRFLFVGVKLIFVLSLYSVSSATRMYQV